MQLLVQNATNVLNSKGTVVQKYGEIYGGVARRQIREGNRKVVNMREKNFYRRLGKQSGRF